MIIPIVASPLMYNAISCIVDLSWTLTSRRSSSDSLITSAALNSYIMSGTTLSPTSPLTSTSASLTSMQNCLVQVCRFVFPHQAHELDASGNYTTTMCFLHVSLHLTSKSLFLTRQSGSGWAHTVTWNTLISRNSWILAPLTSSFMVETMCTAQKLHLMAKFLTGRTSAVIASTAFAHIPLHPAFTSGGALTTTLHHVSMRRHCSPRLLLWLSLYNGYASPSPVWID